MNTQPDKPQQRILCLWLTNWPIQRLVVAQPELKRKRIVLFRQDSRRGQLVAAASPLAQRDGVEIAMPMSEAKSLLWRGARNSSTSPTDERMFHTLPHDPAADLYAIEKLADDLDEFSPIIGLQNETAHPECIFLDITGIAQLFGGEDKLASRVFAFCQQQGYLAAIAVADTVGQAQGTAQFSRLTTASATAPAPATKPNPHTRIVRDANAFHDLPVNALRLESWITETLYGLGIRTIGQLLRLPRRDLTARFGKEIHTRIDQMSGRSAEPIVARQSQSEFYAEQLLDYPTSHRETIEVILQKLIGNVCRQMKSVQQGALQWTLRLYCQDQKLPLKLYVNLFQPTATAEHVVQLAEMQLEQLLQPSGRRPAKKAKSKAKFAKLAGQALAVQEITVTVTSCVLLEHRQRKLFDENPRLDKQSLTHLINRLSGRLGRQNVVYPAMVSGAQPEYAFQLKPLVNPYGRGPRRTAGKQNTQQLSHTLARPFKVFKPAIPLHTIAIAIAGGARSPAPPATINYSNTQHKIVHHWGPERIETGWWRGRTTRRDYWRIETANCQQFWIYHDLRRQAWFLQGEF